MTPSIFHISSIYLWSMKIPNREFSHQPYKASSVVTSHGQLDHFTCICRSNMCGCGYVCHMMQARTKSRSVMMSNLNQKHHHTTTATCVCLVLYITHRHSHSQTQVGNHSRQQHMTSTQCNAINNHPWINVWMHTSMKITKQGLMAGHADPVFFFLSRNPVVSARCCVCARHMYLRDNIWGSHRRDQLRKKAIAAAGILFFAGEAGLPSKTRTSYLQAKSKRRCKVLRCKDQRSGCFMNVLSQPLFKRCPQTVIINQGYILPNVFIEGFFHIVPLRRMHIDASQRPATNKGTDSNR